MIRHLRRLLLALALAGCVTANYRDTSDAARRHQILGHWYDQYLQGFNYAQGDTVYRSDGTFSASYESVSPGTSAAEPTKRETVSWSGKWKVDAGQLVEDITVSSDFSKTPVDRPMIRYFGRMDAKQMTLRNYSGNVNEYARKRPLPPKVGLSP